VTPADFDAFEALGALVVVVASSGKIVHWNRACSLLTGSGVDEVRGEHVWDLLHEPEEIDSVRSALARILGDGQPGRLDNHWTTGAGERRLVTWSISTVVGAQGNDAWIVMTGIDITPHERSSLQERKQTNAQLFADMDADSPWLRAVLDTAPLGILLFEPGGRLSFNRRAEELLGIPLSPTRGSAQYVNRILYPDGTPVPPDRLASARVLRSGETIAGEEYVIQRPDGSRVAVLGSAAPIRDAAGGVIGAVVLFQDISERMRAAEAIRKNERLLDGIFEILPVGVWIADETGRIVRTNAAGLGVWAGARYVGTSEFDQYVAWWADTGELIAADEWALARALNKGETSIGEMIRIRCFDGTFKTIINSALPLRDEQGKFAGAIVVNEDVTCLKEIEEALRHAVRAREEILGVVAHDLRNPLNTIMLQLQLMRRRDDGAQGAGEQMIERIRKAAMRMNRLIEDLLDVVRIDASALSLERDCVPARSLLTELVESQREAASHASLHLHLDLPGELPELWADHDRLLQALENLLGNAIKFTQSGGDITVGATLQGNEIVFSVADNGAGIPAESLPHLFDRFWQARRTDKRGAGLGLAIVKGIIETHGGRIWAKSRLGEGTTIFFTVPAGRGAEAHALDAPAPLSLPGAGA
jgi:PAS domain S-box-containing protein